jgi:hypothetical protein
MLDCIMQNKEWLFSGIAVAVPLAIIGWWYSKRKSDSGAGSSKSTTYSINQTHSGGGDNVGRDKIVKE